MSAHTQKCYPDGDKANDHYKEETVGKTDTENEAPTDGGYQN
jgi:hypothetical protein